MRQLLIARDLHNTLLCSGPAWEQAFVELSGSDEKPIRKALAEKCSRHLLAKQLGISYDAVYKRYGELVQINHGIVSAIACLQGNYPLVLISSASRTRVEKDLQKLDGILSFDHIFTKETFWKNRTQDWDKLRECYGVSRILYFGNDPSEDISPAPFVQTVLVPLKGSEERYNED